MNGGAWFLEGLQGLTTLDSDLADMTSALSQVRVRDFRSVPHNLIMRRYGRAYITPDSFSNA